uniref:Interleukin 25 n=1 Tax=Ornithorhynchus anatinus TaxID=9258 RepID=A0A6I8MZ67_ORNAN
GIESPRQGQASMLTPLSSQIATFLVMAAGALPLRAHPWLCTHPHHCCLEKGQGPYEEEWLKWNSVPPASLAVPSDPDTHHCRASQDGPINSRAISPWTYMLDRDENRLPQDLYQARCLCPHCVSLRTGSGMNMLGNSELLWHNQTVFYRRPCRGGPGPTGRYYLEHSFYPVSFACVCVRPRVLVAAA